MWSPALTCRTLPEPATQLQTSNLGGNLTNLVLDQQAAASVSGTVSGVSVDVVAPYGSDEINPVTIFGIDNHPIQVSDNYAPPGDYFSGLAVKAGGIVGNVVDAGAMGIESGGVSVNTLVTGLQFTFANSKAYNDLIGQTGVVYDSGSLIYNGSGSYDDAGQIVTATIGDSPYLSPTPSVTETFGTGNVVQAGDGTLTLGGDNSYSGGTILESGTVEIASATGAGTGAIEFLPNAGFETLKIDNKAFTHHVFSNSINGLGLGSVIDLPGIAFQLGDRSVVTSDGSLQLQSAHGQSQASFFLGSGSAPGTSFLTLPDQTGGTSIFAVPTKLLTDVGAAIQQSFAAPLEQIIADLTGVGSSSLSSIDILAGLGFASYTASAPRAVESAIGMHLPFAEEQQIAPFVSAIDEYVKAASSHSPLLTEKT